MRLGVRRRESIVDARIGRYAVVKVGPSNWLIHDTLYESRDARRLVAYIEGSVGYDDVDVTWVRSVGLPTHHASIDHALAQLAAHEAAPRPSRTRPVPIASHPPITLPATA
jgi:hypothetical protein